MQWLSKLRYGSFLTPRIDNFLLVCFTLSVRLNHDLSEESAVSLIPLGEGRGGEGGGHSFSRCCYMSNAICQKTFHTFLKSLCIGY